MIDAKIDDNQNVELHMEVLNDDKFTGWLRLLADLQYIVVEALNSISKRIPTSHKRNLQANYKILLGAFITGILNVEFHGDKEKIMDYIDEYIIEYLEVQ